MKIFVGRQAVRRVSDSEDEFTVMKQRLEEVERQLKTYRESFMETTSEQLDSIVNTRPAAEPPEREPAEPEQCQEPAGGHPK